MSTFTRENTEIAVELGDLGQQHRADVGGMIVALERWQAGLDTGEMFAELPDGACQEPHWGYVVSGSVTMRYTDGTSEKLDAGQAYYMKPGHNVHVDADVELVEFTPSEQTPPGINTLQREVTSTPSR